MAETTTQDASEDPKKLSWAEKRAERQAGRLARQIGSFAKAHGGSAEGHLGYIGRERTRIVLVGEDGGWGDLVAPGHAIAARAVELAGITVHDALDGEIAAKVRTGPYEWSRMAGIQLGGPANPSNSSNA